MLLLKLNDYTTPEWIGTACIPTVGTCQSHGSSKRLVQRNVKTINHLSKKLTTFTYIIQTRIYFKYPNFVSGLCRNVHLFYTPRIYSVHIVFNVMLVLEMRTTSLPWIKPSLIHRLATSLVDISVCISYICRVTTDIVKVFLLREISFEKGAKTSTLWMYKYLHTEKLSGRWLLVYSLSECFSF